MWEVVDVQPFRMCATRRSWEFGEVARCEVFFQLLVEESLCPRLGMCDMRRKRSEDKVRVWRHEWKSRLCGGEDVFSWRQKWRDVVLLEAQVSGSFSSH